MRITANKELELKLSNQNTIDQKHLEFEKQTLLFDVLRNNAKQIVKHNSTYPKDGYVKTNINCDFYIIDADTFDLLTKKLESNGEILEFRKLKINT